MRYTVTLSIETIVEAENEEQALQVAMEDELNLVEAEVTPLDYQLKDEKAA
jgi:hypothetical protein